MDEIKSYAEIVKHTRKNFQPKGFDFDVNTFENLIDNYVPEENIPVILRCNLGTLDKFCKIVYKMDFKQTYRFLMGITDMCMRKTIKGLAGLGNTTALKIAQEHFMKLKSDDGGSNVNITIVDDRNGD